MVLEACHHDHLPSIINYNDLAGCYDRLIEAPTKMSA
jgi:hypothetical protein